MLKGTARMDIAIIGMAVRVAGARTLSEYCRNILEGVESLSSFTDAELREEGIGEELLQQPGYVRAKGVMEGVDRFDAEFFGYSHAEASTLDPKTRVFHEVAYHALEDAGYTGRHGASVGVFVGASEDAEWLRRSMDRLPTDSSDRLEAGLLIHKDQLAQQLAYRLDLRGPTFALYTSCSTSLAAVHLACQSLLSGECDLALAGGVTLDLPCKSGHLWSEGMVYSKDGHCRPFDAGASGFVFGDGAAVVALKRLDEACADRDRIHAVILGTAVNNDGRCKVGFVAPSLEGQAQVIRAALDAAGVDSESIAFVEAHGTGTTIGDPVEFGGLVKAFQTRRSAYCALGSVKANIGHTHAAAGTAGLIKAALAVREGVIPPLVNFRRPNDKLPLQGSPFFIPDRACPWPSGFPVRRAGVSSFGLGGTNAHAVLEAPPERPEVVAGSRFIVPYSGRNEEALEKLETALRRLIDEADREELARLAYTQQVGRREMEHRRVLLVHMGESPPPRVCRLDGPGRRAAARTSLGLWLPDPRGMDGATAASIVGRGPVYSALLDQAVARASLRRSELPLGAAALREAAAAGDGLAAACLAYTYGCALCQLLPDLELLRGSGAGELVAAAVVGLLPWEEIAGALLEGDAASPLRSSRERRTGGPVLFSSLSGEPLGDEQLRDPGYWQQVLGSGAGAVPPYGDVLWLGPHRRPLVASADPEPRAGAPLWSWESALAEAWCHGSDVNWRGLEDGEGPGRGSSALYPFAGTEVPLPPPVVRTETAPKAAPPSSPAVESSPRPSLSTPYRAPVTPVGARIVELMEEVLGTAPIGMDDDFWELGGDSLVAVQLAMRFERALGVHLDVSTMLEEPCAAAILENLAEVLAKSLAEESEAAPR